MISMAALSYGIVGDIGDRFWNGYFLTYLRNIPELLPDPDPEAGTKDVNDWFRRQHKNHQRKILESYATVIFYPLSFVAVSPLLQRLQHQPLTKIVLLGSFQHARRAVSIIHVPEGFSRTDSLSKYTTTAASLEATAIALVVTLVIVLNAETVEIWHPLLRLMLVLVWGLGFPAFSRVTPIIWILDSPAPGKPLENLSIHLQYLQ